MSADPRYVTSAQLRAAYDALGFDPELFDSTRLIRLDRRYVVATRTVRDGSGRRYVAADGEVVAEVSIAEVVDSDHAAVTPYPITPDTEPDTGREATR